MTGKGGDVKVLCGDQDKVREWKRIKICDIYEWKIKKRLTRVFRKRKIRKMKVKRKKTQDNMIKNKRRVRKRREI